MTPKDHQHDDALDELPDALADTLADADRPVLGTVDWAATDAAVRADAGGVLRGVRERRRLALRWRIGVPAAAAAAVALVVWVSVSGPGAAPSGAPAPAVAANDLNADGAVDVLDALLLQHEAEAGRADAAAVAALRREIVSVTR